MADFGRFGAFTVEEDGAVTVDWVVLTAAIVILSITVVASVQRAATDQATGIGATTLDRGSCALDPTFC